MAPLLLGCQAHICSTGITQLLFPSIFFACNHKSLGRDISLCYTAGNAAINTEIPLHVPEGIFLQLICAGLAVFYNLSMNQFFILQENLQKDQPVCKL